MFRISHFLAYVCFFAAFQIAFAEAAKNSDNEEGFSEEEASQITDVLLAPVDPGTNIIRFFSGRKDGEVSGEDITGAMIGFRLLNVEQQSKIMGTLIDAVKTDNYKSTKGVSDLAAQRIELLWNPFLSPLFKEKMTEMAKSLRHLSGDEEKIRILNILKTSSPEGIESEMVALIKTTKNRDVAVGAANVLGAIPTRVSTEALLTSVQHRYSLSEEDELLLVQAVREALASRDNFKPKELEPYLIDKNSPFNESAAIILTSKMGNEVTPILINAFLKLGLDPTHQLTGAQTTIMEALRGRKIRSSEVASVLIKALGTPEVLPPMDEDKERTEYQRRDIIESLGAIGEELSLPILLPILKSETPSEQPSDEFLRALDSLAESGKGAAACAALYKNWADKMPVEKQVRFFTCQGEAGKSALLRLFNEGIANLKNGNRTGKGVLGEDVGRAIEGLSEISPTPEILDGVMYFLSDPSHGYSGLQAIVAENSLPQIFGRNELMKFIPMVVSDEIDPDVSKRILANLLSLDSPEKDIIPSLVQEAKGKDNASVRKAIFEIENQISWLPDDKKGPVEKIIQASFEEHRELLDVCETVCGLVKKNAQWFKQEDLNHGGIYDMAVPNSTWEYTNRNLSMLFLTKAAPYCGLSADSFLKLRATKVPTVTTSPDVFYGLQYHILLLQNALKDVKDSQLETTLRLELKTAENQLRSVLQQYHRLSGNRYGSGINAFAYSTALVSLPNPPDEAIAVLRARLADARDPLAISYFINNSKIYPGLSDSATKRSAAARDVPFHLSLYLNAETIAEKRFAAARLIDAIENFREHAGSLAMQLPREEAHTGRDNLAPYYYYPAVPYVTAGIAALLEDPAVNKTDKTKLADIQKGVSRGLMGLIYNDGLFKPMGPIYSGSSLYINPLGGLALLPTIETCGGKPQARSSGIIEKKAMEEDLSRPQPQLSH